MNNTAVFVHTNMSLVPEMPSIPLFGGMRIGIPLPFLVFGRGRGGNDGRIHNGSLFQNEPSVCQGFYNKSKKLFVDAMLDQEIAESSDGISIGNLIARFYTAKIRKGATVHNLVAGPLVGQRIQILQKMNPEHQFQVIGFISVLPLIVARSDKLLQLSPWHDAVVLLQKLPLVRFDLF